MKNKYFSFKKSRVEQTKARIICFPYAGGGASIFSNWAPYLPQHLELIALQLPGRETRLNEKLLYKTDEVVQNTLKEIELLLDLPYVIYGHSMGALLAFECARTIAQKPLTQPKLCIVSGRNAPKIKSDTQINQTNDIVLINWLRQFNGTSEEIFENQELMRMLLRVIRADLAVTENYRFENTTPLQIPLVACGANADPIVPLSGLAAWQAHTSAEFYMEVFSGGHFFNFKNIELFIEKISKYLLSSLPLTTI